MATKLEDKIRQQTAQIRQLKRKTPLRERLELVVTKGAPAYSGGLIIGYVEETAGPEKAAQVTAGMAFGGILALFCLNPKQNSLVEIVLSGATGAGMAVTAKEHGATVGRYHRVRKAQTQLEQEHQAASQAAGQIDDVENPVLDTETETTSERVTG